MPSCKNASRVALAILLFAVMAGASAEPYFAVETGNRCAACHVNPSGGGKRTAYGNAFAQKVLAAREVPEFWDGRFDSRFRIGGDLRGNFAQTTIPGAKNKLAFDFEEAIVYAELRLLEDTLTLYVDERIAPGGATNRETYALFRFYGGQAHLKAGRMFLPYGWRLEDDSEFIRQVTGINYATPDDGVEVGVELPNLSVQLAITNGTAGAGENDIGKQYSLRVSRLFTQQWRAGFSFNLNDTDDFGNRRMQNIFAGLRTGKIDWLGEVDYIVDDTFTDGQRKQWISFVEANVRVRRGHNLKFTYGWFDPDADLNEDERARYSVVWEYFPIPYVQLSLGARNAQGIPQSAVQNTDEYFLQLHGFF